MWYTVSLYSVGDGETIGSGRYSNRETSYVFCSAIPYTGSSFDHWTGDFRGRRNVVGFAINKDVTSTAYFVSAIGDPDDPNDPLNRPCFSDDSGVFNPLKEMILASPGYSGIRGGTFGYVRMGDTKYHSGLDLLAEVGTPVYAMIDGVIAQDNYVITQPDKDTEKYPDGYTGDINGAGNRVYIEGVYEGMGVKVGYWHLQAGTPIAVNPRTGSMYKPGDVIFRGELLGYTGRTGNAYNVTNKHLHLVYKVKNSNGKYVYKNPEEIINGLVNWKDGDSSTKKILDGAIVEIDCDPEEILITL